MSSIHVAKPTFPRQHRLETEADGQQGAGLSASSDSSPARSSDSVECSAPRRPSS